MSPAELMEWRAFDRIDPIGPDRMDWNFALLTSAVASMLSTGTGKTPTPKDLVPCWDPVEAERKKASGLKLAMLRAAMQAGKPIFNG